MDKQTDGGKTDRWTDGQMDGRTDRQTDGQTGKSNFIGPSTGWGSKKVYSFFKDNIWGADLADKLN